MNQEDKIKEDFKRLSLAIQRAVEAEQVWREFGSPENHNKYSTQFDIYIPFFNTTRDLALCQLLTFVSRAYDSASGALNIEKLLKRMKKANYPVQEIDELMRLYSSHDHLWKKIKILRDECIAHTSSNYSEKMAFKNANIKNDEVSLAVDVARNILVKSGEIIGVRNSYISKGNLEVKEDCNKLLRNLKAGREARLNSSADSEYT